jgi:hypothetical protein
MTMEPEKVFELAEIRRYIRDNQCPSCGAKPGEECQDSGPDNVHLARCWSEKSSTASVPEVMFYVCVNDTGPPPHYCVGAESLSREQAMAVAARSNAWPRIALYVHRASLGIVEGKSEFALRRLEELFDLLTAPEFGVGPDLKS